jgi:hypothetical protein
VRVGSVFGQRIRDELAAGILGQPGVDHVAAMDKQPFMEAWI